METFPSGSLQYGSIYDLFRYAISLFKSFFLKYVFVNEYATWCVWMNVTILKNKNYYYYFLNGANMVMEEEDRSDREGMYLGRIWASDH